MKHKIAQAPSGANASVLVLLIAAFVLIYILLLPSEERNRLLDTEEGLNVSAAGQAADRILLEERPGTIAKVSMREFEHAIPSFNLIVQKEDAILKKADSLFIESRGVNTRAIPLFINGKAENGKLTFTVQDHQGVLTIRFNGEEIFRGEVANIVEPLTLDNLKAENILEFSVDVPPQWMFWQRNMYDIRNVQVAATVENVENQKAVTTFFMTKEEAEPENIEEAFLIYIAECRQSGRLSVSLNNKLLSSKVPECGNIEKTFIDPRDFAQGRNELTFVAESGKYIIDQIFVKTQLKKPIFPVYFFDVNATQLRQIENNTANTSLHLSFINNEKKSATIEVNGHRIFLDTTQTEYARNIDPFIIEGSNSIRIEPERTLHVKELRVLLDCRNPRNC